MNGIKNFLQFLNDNWTSIAVILGLIVALIQKIKAWLEQSDEKKIEFAKKQITESILRMITEAEIDFEDWNKAGQIKRSQVIKEIYKEYPILEKVADQDELIKWIDEQIDESLVTLRKVVALNQKSTEVK